MPRDEARRDDPERHPEGVHGPQHVHLSARARACGSSRTSSSTRRSTCRSSTRSRSAATTCRRPARRTVQELAFTLADGLEYVRAALSQGPRRRRVRAAALVLLVHRHELLHGDRQAARRAPALGASSCSSSSRRRTGARSMLRTHCQTSGASLTEQDPLQQRDPHDDRGDGRGARRHAVAAHQRLRRGGGAADATFAARIARNTQLILQEETRHPAR